MKRVRFSKDDGTGIRVTGTLDSPNGKIFVEHDLIANRVRVVLESTSLTVVDPLTGIDLEERLVWANSNPVDVAKFLLAKAGAVLEKESRNRSL